MFHYGIIKQYGTSMTNSDEKRLAFKYALIGDTMRENVLITIDSEGKILKIGETRECRDIDISEQILLPGFVNSHSHAFHRYMRGRSEIGGRGADTFWKWRDNMYALVDGIDRKLLYKYCYGTFKEMVSAGITTVGEFHYVHHGTARFDLDEAVLEAAKDVGIRIVLIQTLYERAGFDSSPLHPVQKRHFVSEYAEFVDNVDLLLQKPQQRNTTIAVAAHSTRAVPMENIVRLYQFAKERGLVFHIHLEEQPKEILDCMHNNADKRTPSDHLLQNLAIDSSFTAVHATYTSPENMNIFSHLGANISLCPCTEGYLGDGIPNLNEKTHLSFGTDCNNRICFLEEMRWAAFSKQMQQNSRSVNGLSASKLMERATEGGARSLGIQAVIGSFEVGKQFDAVCFDAKSDVLESTGAEDMIDAIVFSCGNREVCRTFVSGKEVYTMNN